MTDQTFSQPNEALTTNHAREEKYQTVGDQVAVPVTAELPILPEFRDRAQVINWRSALSAASLAAFLAAIAGIGCGGGSTMHIPSPAAHLAGSFSTLNASDAHNPGPVTK